MDSEENSFERCVLSGVVTWIVTEGARCRSVNGNVIYPGVRTAVQETVWQGTVWQR